MSILYRPDAGSIIAIGAITVSLAGAAISRVFSPGTINGPQRLDEDESPGVLAPIAGMGFIAWFLVQIVFVAARKAWFERYHPGQTPPPKLSDVETVVCESAALIAGFAMMMIMTLLSRRNGVARLGIQLSKIPAGFWRALMGIIILIPFVILVSAGADQVWKSLHWNHSDHELLEIFKNDGARWVRILVILSATVFAPLAEETFFRAHVQTILRYTIKEPWPAVLITAVFFAGVHPWWSMPPIFVLAVGLGYLYERFGNLWACIFLHCMFNSIMLLLFYYTTISHPL